MNSALALPGPKRAGPSQAEGGKRGGESWSRIIVMKIIELEWCSPEYQSALEVRHEVLRAPLGLKLTPEELDDEHAQLHFGAFEADQLIATLVVRRQSAEIAQLRQMAVRPENQRQGVGTQLLQSCQSKLQEQGFLEIHLDARVSCLPFYEKLGYSPLGNIFQEVGLDHQKMVKQLG